MLHSLPSYGKILLFTVSSLLCAFTMGATTTKIDLGAAGMDLFTTAYRWETANANGYNTQALEGFTKKLNRAIGLDPNLASWYKQCGCTNPVSTDLDAALGKYLQITSEGDKKSSNYYAGVVLPYVDKKIQTATNREIALLDTLVKNMIDEISVQVREQMDAFRDVSGNGLYYDGDEANSTYDVMSDLKKIDEIFLRQIPEQNKPYKNTGGDDASGLITGQFLSGSWVGGKEYDLNLLGDIKKALEGSGNTKKSGQGNEVAGECESGYCVTVDYIKSTHYFLSSQSGKGGASFQGIYESGLEWITKNGSKRNLACKAPPNINFLESNNDNNFKFSELFSGLGIHVFWKVPQFLADLGSPRPQDEKAQIKKDQEKTSENILRALKRQGIDPNNPYEIVSSKLKIYQNAAIKKIGNQSDAATISESVGNAEKELNRTQKMDASLSKRSFINEKEGDSLVQFEKKFNEQSSSIRSLYDSIDGLNGILKIIQKKPDCGN